MKHNWGSAWRHFEDWVRYECLLMLDWWLGGEGMVSLDEYKVSYEAKKGAKIHSPAFKCVW